MRTQVTAPTAAVAPVAGSATGNYQGAAAQLSTVPLQRHRGDAASEGQAVQALPQLLLAGVGYQDQAVSLGDLGGVQTAVSRQDHVTAVGKAPYHATAELPLEQVGRHRS
ncbi:hypothetical protein [Actinomyces lilanjuaniae]|nr:hypothetical protein [Actinomyces lilanjuaniae]